ncbi:unnamed protein product [Closterium sp. NIES-54]
MVVEYGRRTALPREVCQRRISSAALEQFLNSRMPLECLGRMPCSAQPFFLAMARETRVLLIALLSLILAGQHVAALRPASKDDGSSPADDSNSKYKSWIEVLYEDVSVDTNSTTIGSGDTGSMFMFSTPLYTSKDFTNKVGQHYLSAVAMWNDIIMITCSLNFDNGVITASGAYKWTENEGRVAITGGTGAYVGYSAHKGYNPIRSRCPALPAASPCPTSLVTRYPCRGLPFPPPPLFLAPSLPPAPAPPVPPPPPGPAPSGVSHTTPLPSVARQVASPSPHSSSQSPQQPSALLRHVTVDSVGVGAGGAATGGTRSGGARSRGAGAGGTGAGGASSRGAGAGGFGIGGASFGGAGAGGASTGGASSGGAGAGGVGAGGASSGGAGAGGTGTGGASSGGAGARGAGTEETEARGSPTASPTARPHRHDTRFQPLRRLEREEPEQVVQERQELQQLDQQQQQQQTPQPPPLQQLFPPVSGLRALGLPSSPPVHSQSPTTYGPTFPPPDSTPAVFSPP